MNTTKQINTLERRQLELKAVMQKSDEHALKCFKSGLDFKTTYPDDWTSYDTARQEYNENEAALAALYVQLEEEQRRETEMMAAAMAENV